MQTVCQIAMIDIGVAMFGVLRCTNLSTAFTQFMWLKDSLLYAIQKNTIFQSFTRVCTNTSKIQLHSCQAALMITSTSC